MSGWNLPLSFEFGEDLPTDFQPTLRSYRGSGVVSAVSVSSKPQGVFDPQMKTTVLDRRFVFPDKAINGITYSWSNEFVPATNDTRLQSALKASVERAAYEGLKRKNKSKTASEN